MRIKEIWPDFYVVETTSPSSPAEKKAGLFKAKVDNQSTHSKRVAAIQKARTNLPDPTPENPSARTDKLTSIANRQKSENDRYAAKTRELAGKLSP